MDTLIEFLDQNGKRIRLTKDRWKHIAQEHPDIGSAEEIRETVQQPTAVRPSDRDPNHVKWFYRRLKKQKLYMLVSVKYLNGDGFVITAHFVREPK